MKFQFWKESWDQGGFCTSFHRRDIHPYVRKYLNEQAIRDKNVLVPLCGKSLDMLYMAQYAKRVIGVELIESAIDEFIEDNQLSVTQPTPHVYQIDNITILHRDFFQLEPREIGPVDWIYDRAALVALPATMRAEYRRAVDRLSTADTQTLLITLEYHPLLESAPFSISPNEVRTYYEGGYRISHVESPLLPEHGMVRHWNLDYLYEHGFLLTKVAPPAIPSHASNVAV